MDRQSLSFLEVLRLACHDSGFSYRSCLFVGGDWPFGHGCIQSVHLFTDTL